MEKLNLGGFRRLGKTVTLALIALASAAWAQQPLQLQSQAALAASSTPTAAAVTTASKLLAALSDDFGRLLLTETRAGSELVEALAGRSLSKNSLLFQKDLRQFVAELERSHAGSPLLSTLETRVLRARALYLANTVGAQATTLLSTVETIASESLAFRLAASGRSAGGAIDFLPYASTRQAFLRGWENELTSGYGYPHPKPFRAGKLDPHFLKHGAEFSAASAQEYQARALAFAASSDPDALSYFSRGSNCFYKYKPSTNEFLVLADDGVIKTYFKPSRLGPLENLDYVLSNLGR